MKNKSWEDQQREKHGITAPKFTLYMNHEAQTLMDATIKAGDTASKAEKAFRDGASEPSAYKYTALFDAHKETQEAYETALMDLGLYVKKVYQSLALRPEEE